METLFFTFPEHKIKMFKSYYVVWKRGKKKTCIYIEVRFKSYYVVWKPPLLLYMFFLQS